MTEHQLIVVRHGLTEWARNGRHTGRTDIPLLPEGEADALAVAPILRGRTFADVLTSPLQRARQTAALAGFPDATTDDDLMEWDYGADEGLTSAQMRAERPGWDAWRDGYRGAAENIHDISARADEVIKRVRATQGDTLIFAHSHFLRVLAARWINHPGRLAAHLSLDPAGIGVLGWKDHRPIMVRWNIHAL